MNVSCTSFLPHLTTVADVADWVDTAGGNSTLLRAGFPIDVNVDTAGRYHRHDFASCTNSSRFTSVGVWDFASVAEPGVCSCLTRNRSDGSVTALANVQIFRRVIADCAVSDDALGDLSELLLKELLRGQGDWPGRERVLHELDRRYGAELDTHVDEDLISGEPSALLRAILYRYGGDRDLELDELEVAQQLLRFIGPRSSMGARSAGDVFADLCGHAHLLGQITRSAQLTDRVATWAKEWTWPWHTSIDQCDTLIDWQVGEAFARLQPLLDDVLTTWAQDVPRIRRNLRDVTYLVDLAESPWLSHSHTADRVVRMLQASGRTVCPDSPYSTYVIAPAAVVFVGNNRLRNHMLDGGECIDVPGAVILSRLPDEGQTALIGLLNDGHPLDTSLATVNALLSGSGIDTTSTCVTVSN
jgi:hypothetical protein